MIFPGVKVHIFLMGWQNILKTCLISYIKSIFCYYDQYRKDSVHEITRILHEIFDCLPCKFA
jgi:hypothetical protein